MDNTVIILIGAGVSCVVIGFALFIKLARMSSQEDDEATGNKKLLADDYAENFQECFDNTGSIEDTLEQLADIYTGNQYMYNLIVNALNFLKEDQGDYETALEGINVDSDTSIMKMHNNAIKRALNIESKNNSQKDTKERTAREEAAPEEENRNKIHSEPVSEEEKYDEDEDEYEEDEEDSEEDSGIQNPIIDGDLEPTERKSLSIHEKAAPGYREHSHPKSNYERETRVVRKERKQEASSESFEDDDLDDFKIG